jgi:hypothetical protein
MPCAVYSTYTSDDIDVDFLASYGDFDDMPPDIQVFSLEILGVKVAFHTLPRELQSAILATITERKGL